MENDHLEAFDRYLAEATVGTELRQRMETLQRDINRRKSEAEQMESGARQERAAVVELERLMGEYADALKVLTGA